MTTGDRQGLIVLVTEAISIEGRLDRDRFLVARCTSSIEIVARQRSRSQSRSSA
ncbi:MULTISPECIES: hypothetical protein [unclassified Chamaesiphon]|uniref:hypothetical protein n=1 Tax=unclassified Chamaesiphon TaxID=2620921 RepID=UPI00286B5743|nr:MULTISPECIES: hypothetical protein [unclassified Chamaesiphon]